jgi:hypothetical protein
VVTPDQSAGAGLCQCVYGGTLGSLSVGKSTVFPGAEARVPDGAVTRADRAALRERPGARRDRGLAYPQYHDGEPCLSRDVLCGRLCTSGMAHAVDEAAPRPSASDAATAPRDGAEPRTARRILSPDEGRRAWHSNHLAGLPTATRIHLYHRYLLDRQCVREKCIMLSARR